RLRRLAPELGDRALDPVAQVDPVRQPGQRVVHDLVAQPGLSLLALGHFHPQLAGALLDPLLQARVRLAQGLGGTPAAQAAGDLVRGEGEQLGVARVVATRLRIGLHHDRADRTIAAPQWRAQPAGRGAVHVARIDFAGADQFEHARTVHHLRLAGAQHVLGQAAAGAARRPVGLARVHRVREADLAAVLGQQRDVEIARVDQAADDLVHAAEERFAALLAAGQRGQPVQRGLQALAALAL